MTATRRLEQERGRHHKRHRHLKLDVGAAAECTILGTGQNLQKSVARVSGSDNSSPFLNKRDSSPPLSLYLADLSGDGFADIVFLRNGEVCYWPNLGHGFSAPR